MFIRCFLFSLAADIDVLFLTPKLVIVQGEIIKNEHTILADEYAHFVDIVKRLMQWLDLLVEIDRC